MTFWRGENCGCSQETFLLAKTSKGRWQVYQILHCLCHCQTNHQKARLIHPSSYPEKPWESISMDYMFGLSSTKQGMIV
jgi:hypothetical protein